MDRSNILLCIQVSLKDTMGSLGTGEKERYGEKGGGKGACSPCLGGWTGSDVVGRSGQLEGDSWQDWYQDRYHPQTDRFHGKVRRRAKEFKAMDAFCQKVSTLTSK